MKSEHNKVRIWKDWNCSPQDKQSAVGISFQVESDTDPRALTLVSNGSGLELMTNDESLRVCIREGAVYIWQADTGSQVRQHSACLSIHPGERGSLIVERASWQTIQLKRKAY